MGGFFVKFEVLYSIINSSYFFLGFIVLVCTVVSFYYYLRVIKIIYFEDNLNSKKNKNLDDFQLRIISFGIIILPFFAFFIQESIVYFIYTIITTSFR
jgi:NADH-quinone oxidoreductase subunit N